MKICMVGDSHLAMLVKAQEQDPIAGLDITPVSWPRDGRDQFTFEGSELVAHGADVSRWWAKLGHPERIDLAQFDKVVFVSFTASMFSAFALLRSHAVSGWEEAKPIMASLNSAMGNPGKLRLLTQAAFDASLDAVIRGNHSYQFASQLRAQSDVPISIVPAPYLSETTLKHRPKLVGLKRILRARDGANLANALQSAHQRVFSEIPSVSIFEQPRQTIARGCLTKDDYRIGATRLGSGQEHDANDVLHAGARYGKLVLDQISSE